MMVMLRLLLATTQVVVLVQAFSASLESLYSKKAQRQAQRRNSALWQSFEPWNDDSSSNSYDEDGLMGADYDEARQLFEHIMADESHKEQKLETPPPTPPSYYEERLQEMEYNLLQSLQDSDEPIEILVDLWRNERGAEHAQRLEDMEDSCSAGLFWEERQLRLMIDEFQQEWVEPMARLALLLFTKGHYEEASHWCETSLKRKPWHIEAAQLYLAIKLRRCDYKEAVELARHLTLPDLRDSTNHRRRKQWVERNCHLAKDRLEKTRRLRREALLLELANKANDDDDSGSGDSYNDAGECPIGEICWG